MSKIESAHLILKLYDLRRDATMRDARNWINSFFPESASEIVQTMVDARQSAFYRMVTSYWEMAASFVNHGAIDEEMFAEATGEYVAVFSKIYPFLEELRTVLGADYLKNLEKLIMKQPNAREMLAEQREFLKDMMLKQANLENK